MPNKTLDEISTGYTSDESAEKGNPAFEIGIFELILQLLSGERNLKDVLNEPRLPESVKRRVVEEIKRGEEIKRQRIIDMINSLSPEELEILEQLANKSKEASTN